MRTLSRYAAGGRRDAAFVPLACLVASLMIAGCGGSTPTVALHPASGKVVLEDGKPLGSGTVRFVPIEAAGAMAEGKLGADGSFTLSVPNKGPGAAEGACRVYIVPEGSVDAKRPPFPLPYMDEETSPITVTIKPGDNKLEPIVLTSKIARPGTPGAASKQDGRED